MMTCAEFEILYADYLDGTLPAAERATVEQHMAGCASCRQMAGEISGAVAVMRAVPEIEVPADLITRIAYQAPMTRVRDPLARRGWFERTLGHWLQPILQPRLVMGMAMTVLSFAMLERCTGIQVQHIQAADLNPGRVWDGVENKTLRTRDRVLKYYENLRWVYEIEIRLRAMQEQQAAEAEPEKSGEQKAQNGDAK